MNNLTVTKKERYWACMVYLICVFAGVMPTILFTIVSIAFKMIEKSEYTEKAVLRPLVVLLLFYTLDKVAVLIPTVLQVCNNIVSVYDLQYAQGMIGNVANMMMTIFDIIQTLLVIMIIVGAVVGRTVSFPFIDNIVNAIYNAVNVQVTESSEEDSLREEEELSATAEVEE